MSTTAQDTIGDEHTQAMNSSVTLALVEVLEAHTEIAWNHQTSRAICADCDADLAPMSMDIDEQSRLFRQHQATALAVLVREFQAQAREAAAEAKLDGMYGESVHEWLQARAGKMRTEDQ